MVPERGREINRLLGVILEVSRSGSRGGRSASHHEQRAAVRGTTALHDGQVRRSSGGGGAPPSWDAKSDDIRRRRDRPCPAGASRPETGGEAPGVLIDGEPVVHKGPLHMARNLVRWRFGDQPRRSAPSGPGGLRAEGPPGALPAIHRAAPGVRSQPGACRKRCASSPVGGEGTVEGAAAGR